MSRRECCSHESNVVLFFVGIAVSGLMLHLNAKELPDGPSFKASRRWYEKWKRRHSVSMWTKTTLAQRLPTNLKENTVRFHGFVIAARRRADYPLSCISNMDETPMHFELPSNRTLEFSDSDSKILLSGRGELHRRSCCCCRWSKGAPESHLQRCPYTKRSGCAASSSCFLP